MLMRCICLSAASFSSMGFDLDSEQAASARNGKKSLIGSFHAITTINRQRRCFMKRKNVIALTKPLSLFRRF